MNLKICKLEEARYIHDGWASTTLSIVNSDGPKIYYGPNHTVLRFDDVTTLSYDRIRFSLPHLEEFTKWIDSIKDDDNVLIHCHQGISRSPALAIAMLIRRGMDIETALETVIRIRPKIAPNMWILGAIDRRWNLGGKLVQVVGNWSRTQPLLS